MPVEIKEYVLGDNKGIIVDCIGYVSGQNIIDTLQSVYADPAFAEHEFWLVERSNCERYDVHPNDIKTIARNDNEAVKKNPKLIKALVSANNLQHGMSRMYSSYLSEDGFEIAMFLDRSEAEEWIVRRLKEINEESRR